MKALTLAISLLIASLSFSYAQNPIDSIVAKKISFGYQFYQGKKPLMIRDFYKLLESNENTKQIIKPAKHDFVAAFALSYIGGAAIGYTLGDAFMEGDPMWELAAVGLGFIAVSIPFNISFNKKALEAVKLHNENVGASRFWEDKKLNF